MLQGIIFFFLLSLLVFRVHRKGLWITLYNYSVFTVFKPGSISIENYLVMSKMLNITYSNRFQTWSHLIPITYGDKNIIWCLCFKTECWLDLLVHMGKCTNGPIVPPQEIPAQIMLELKLRGFILGILFLSDISVTKPFHH